jgi:LmbE family N-acetylglucosaminyl deacetylase
MLKDILSYNKYLLVIPHPDDEVECASLINRIISSKKEFKIILVTNGDAGENPELRLHEMSNSVKYFGINQNDFYSLNISEKSLFENYLEIYGKVRQIVEEYKPDCLITAEYEGGHEGHDSVNFLAHQAIKEFNTVHLTYPVYHFREMKRYGVDFQEGKKTDFTLELTEEEKELKIKLIQIHSGQIGYYLRLQKNQDNYFPLFFKRELYRVFPKDFDYLSRPEYQIGYEYHRNGFKFEDFRKAAEQLLQSQDNKAK